MLQVFTAEKHDSGRCWEERTIALVVANTEAEALGLILMQYPTTETRNWQIVPIDLETVEVHELIDYEWSR